MLRRAPVRIEGENYGRSGPGKSYFVLNTRSLSKNYRPAEPVPVIFQEATRRQSDQYALLGAKEWTDYTVWSDSPRDYALSVKVKALNGPAVTKITIGDQSQLVTIFQDAWTVIKLDPMMLTKGKNDVKGLMTSGTADLDWLQLSPSETTSNPPAALLHYCRGKFLSDCQQSTYPLSGMSS